MRGGHRPERRGTDPSWGGMSSGVAGRIRESAARTQHDPTIPRIIPDEAEADGSRR
jgi:hypothetical protein